MSKSLLMISSNLSMVSTGTMENCVLVVIFSFLLLTSVLNQKRGEESQTLDLDDVNLNQKRGEESRTLNLDDVNFAVNYVG
jgi:hypothetical protein